jgi:acetyl-CoA carboxylase beta subunit
MEARISTDTEQSINLWYKCTRCQEFAFRGELDRNLYTCSYCGTPFPLLAEKRIEYLLDDAPTMEIKSTDTTGLAVEGRISDYPVSFFIVDIDVIPTEIDLSILLAAIENSLQKQIPLITIVACQPEGSEVASTEITYLTMQIEQLADASLPHITVLTETEVCPLATYLPLGELVIAEGSAPSQKRTSLNLQPALHAPEEQLLTQTPVSDIGAKPDISVDCYVPRAELPHTLGRFLKFFSE